MVLGRSFLHDYDAGLDHDGSTLELPADDRAHAGHHWINWQYRLYLRPAAPRQRQQVLHNVVGGSLNVFEGQRRRPADRPVKTVAVRRRTLECTNHCGQAVIIDAPGAAIAKRHLSGTGIPSNNYWITAGCAALRRDRLSALRPRSLATGFTDATATGS